MKTILIIYFILMLNSLSSCSTSQSLFYLYKFSKPQSIQSMGEDSSLIYGLSRRYTANGKKLISIERKAIKGLKEMTGIGCQNLELRIDQFSYSNQEIYKVRLNESAYMKKNDLCFANIISLELTQYLEDPHGHAYLYPPFYDFLLSKNKINNLNHLKMCKVADCLKSL